MSYLKISGFKNSKWAVTAVLVFVNFVFFVFSAYLDSRRLIYIKHPHSSLHGEGMRLR